MRGFGQSHRGHGVTAPSVKLGQSNRQSSGKAPTRPRAGFTLLELLVVVAIIAVLAALLLPVLSRAKGAARSARCKSNLHQVALAFTIYLQENSDKYPEDWLFGPSLKGKAGAWTVALLPSLSQGGDVFFCPTRTAQAMSSLRVGHSDQLGPSWSGVPYDYNSQGTAKRDGRSRLGLAWSAFSAAIPANEVREAQVKVPSDMVALSEPAGAYTQITLSSFGWGGGMTSASTNWTGAVHNGSGNGLFCDGHVESQKPARWQAPTDQARRRWNIDNEPHRETW